MRYVQYHLPFLMYRNPLGELVITQLMRSWLCELPTDQFEEFFFMILSQGAGPNLSRQKVRD